MYSVFKNDLANLIIDVLRPIKFEYKKIMNDKTYLREILKDGSDYAICKSNKTLSKVYRKVGLVKNI